MDKISPQPPTISIREREAINELVADVITACQALAPFMSMLTHTTGGKTSETRRNDNLRLVQALIGRLQAEDSAQNFLEGTRSKM
jgi:hypothetical protein